MIRSYHTLDAETVPPYEGAGGRAPVLLSGSLGAAYPLRTRIYEAKVPGINFLRHPGYHSTGSFTPAYLKELSRHKVAICTASKYGYALRKIIEATACGCRVLTDLPVDEVLPEIDANLVRVNSNISMEVVTRIVKKVHDKYDPSFQEEMAKKAIARYDYRVEGTRLVSEIEKLRRSYCGGNNGSSSDEQVDIDQFMSRV
jgi:hypothetical protein